LEAFTTELEALVLKLEALNLRLEGAFSYCGRYKDVAKVTSKKGVIL